MSDDNKLDEDLYYLQRQIHVIQDDRKRIVKETRILLQRVAMLSNQLNDANAKCNSLMEAMERKLQNSFKLRDEEKSVADRKYKQQIVFLNKRKDVLKQFKKNKAKKAQINGKLVEENDADKKEFL